MGSATASLILFCSFRGRDDAAVVRVLECRPAVWLGSVSYSLYLIHFPLLPLVARPVAMLGLPPVLHLLTLLPVAILAVLTATYPFHVLFERPWMPGRPRNQAEAALAAAVSPAP